MQHKTIQIPKNLNLKPRKIHVPCFASLLSQRSSRPQCRAASVLQMPSLHKESHIALLHSKKIHAASLTAALLLQDAEDCLHIVTASLDKTIADWNLQKVCEKGFNASLPLLDGANLRFSGAPVFSLVQGPEQQTTPICTRKGCHPATPAVFLGTAAKEVVAWRPGSSVLCDKMTLRGHTGWVRALATWGKYLFSCGCNHLRQWDTTFPAPREVAATALPSGDILALATGAGHIFAGSADGCLRAWELGRDGGMRETAVRERAHDGRISALLVHNNFVFTAGFDGCIKAWSAHGLELVMEARAAHAGERIHCLALGPDGAVYSGGDDKLIRRWHAALLEPLCGSLTAHSASVRVLAGSNGLVVSGDADGVLCVWQMETRDYL